MYPRGVNSQTIQRIFQRADTNRNGSIDAHELQRALSNGINTEFNMHTVQMMIAMFDRDFNGTIECNEFEALFNYIQRWRDCFMRFDTDRSGTIDAGELSVALQSFGYTLSPNFTRMMIARFDRTHRGVVAFDDFVYACICLQQLTNAFRPYDLRGNGWAQMSFEQFLSAAFSVIV
ncbi:unnamed protein product [Calicophoron daubneyi]|uniref:EF-hand domain-containing protein n=1 Tax=Calicophoron daubneyi TaxID=300641 RepID=A0AAV2TQG6_CALDB